VKKHPRGTRRFTVWGKIKRSKNGENKEEKATPHEEKKRLKRIAGKCKRRRKVGGWGASPERRRRGGGTQNTTESQGVKKEHLEAFHKRGGKQGFLEINRNRENFAEQCFGGPGNRENSCSGKCVSVAKQFASRGTTLETRVCPGGICRPTHSQQWIQV